ncbi:phage tail tape measure protein [Rodentibacter myodis]|uniref:Phage tail tape measure protein domain-containing protein n=1 Tax=Rodentibacter myodis TaxID=1907939 RepID=A0A1V3JS86_9PAST|nr:phage tail tape measure protein [Rodentibacter myodis]OOF59288.1 hypothetical protein BKL49_04230 [Rodentibacter myodis]
MAKMTLALALKAQDYASRVIDKMRGNVNKATQEITNQTVQSGTRQQESVRRTARVTEQSFRQMQQAARVVARDRESLGIRSENTIQREIAQTIAAYQRLRASGMASSRELARAAEVTRAKIASLNAEMGKTTWGQRAAGFMRAGGAIVAGAVGIKNKIAPALNDKKQWDSNVAEVALTAFSDKSADYIKNEGFAKINQAVLDTVDKYGGTADQALQGLDGMLKGGMNFDEAVANLGTSQKMQIAANASGEDVGSLVKTLSDYGFKGNDLNKALEMVLQSGYDGKFEVSDMVSKLPSILSTAKNNAYSGIEDFKFILSWLQSAANKAGSNDEAATNVSNALNKQTAADTVTRLKKLDHPALKGKGIDVEKSMLDGAKKGMNPMQVLLKIVEEMLKGDKAYQALRKKLANATKETEKQEIQRQLDLKRGFLISQVMPDVQAKAGVIAATDKEQTAQYSENLEEGKLGKNIDKAVSVKNSTSAAVEAKADSLKFLQSQPLLGKVNDLGKAYDQWFISQMKDHPELAGIGQVASVAGSAAMYGLGGYMMGGLGSLGLGVGTTVTGSGATTASTLSGAGSSVLASVARLAGIFGSVLTLSGDTQKDPEKEKQVTDRNLRTKTLLNKVRDGSANEAEQAEFKGMNSVRYVDDELNAAFNDFSRFYSLFTSKQQKNASLDYLKSRLEKGDVTDADSKAIQAILDDYSAKSAAQAEENARLAAKYPKQYQQIMAARTTDYSGLTNSANDTNSALHRTLGELSVFSNYQAEFQHLGQTISDGLRTAIESQNFTIQNQIKVDLDGRIVAEQTSEHQYQEMKRWG